MAQVKVIDLQERVADIRLREEDHIMEETQVGQEKISYMIIKAKEEVNEAMKVLFAKDSKMHQLNAGALLATKTKNGSNNLKVE